MDITVTKNNGDVFSFSEFGVKTLDLVVSSLSPRNLREEVEGSHGFVDLETTYDGRTLLGSFILEAPSTEEYSPARNKVFKLLNSLEPFYLEDSREPDRKWLVKVNNPFSFDQVLKYGFFEVEFLSPSPYAESINQVAHIHTDNFTFNNIGDVEIDMVTQQETEIEFRGLSQGLTIRNNTTAQQWRYNGSTNEDDVICLKGIRSTKNGISIFGQTNRQVFKFVPGWNNIEILNAEDYELTIKTRFYYI